MVLDLLERVFEGEGFLVDLEEDRLGDFFFEARLLFLLSFPPAFPFPPAGAFFFFCEAPLWPL